MTAADEILHKSTLSMADAQLAWPTMLGFNCGSLFG